MASDLWHDLVRKLRRIEDEWKPRQPLPGVVTATHGSFMGGGILHAADSWRIPSGVLQAMPGYQTISRVANVVKAIEDAEPVAFNTVAKRLGNITLDDVKPILAAILKDIALYVGGSTLVGAGIGFGLGSLAGGVGAIPGAAAGAAVGAEIGNLILTFTGLKSIAIYMKDAVPTACKYYVAGFKEAWGPRDFGGRKPFVSAATDDFAKGHVLFLTALLMGIVAYLTRGKGNMASLLAEVRGSARLGPKMAAWLEQNEGKLLNSAELRQGVRSEGVGGGEAAAPKSDIPRPMRGQPTSDNAIAPEKINVMRTTPATPTSVVSDATKRTSLGKVLGEYSAVEPGPLPDNMASTFAGGKYSVVELDQDTTLCRAGTADQPLGQFFSTETPSSELQTRIDKAVLPVWPGGATSPIDTVFSVNIPAGTQVYVGEVGSQGGFFVGGTEQIVVVKPWTIEGVQVLDSSPLP